MSLTPLRYRVALNQLWLDSKKERNISLYHLQAPAQNRGVSQYHDQIPARVSRLQFTFASRRGSVQSGTYTCELQNNLLIGKVSNPVVRWMSCENKLYYSGGCYDGFPPPFCVAIQLSPFEDNPRCFYIVIGNFIRAHRSPCKERNNRRSGEKSNK